VASSARPSPATIPAQPETQASASAPSHRSGTLKREDF
jgi:hypothetical protein